MKIHKEVVNKATVYYVELSNKKELNSAIDLSNKLIFQEKNIDGKYKAIVIEQPFLSKKIRIIYADSAFHKEGKRKKELETTYDRATVSIIVKGDKIITSAVSGSDYHDKHGCERQKKGIISGQYELCPGCHPDVHSEAKALRSSVENKTSKQLIGATNFLYNHWWVCEDCSKKMEEAMISKVVLSRKWTREFLNIKEL